MVNSWLKGSSLCSCLWRSDFSRGVEPMLEVHKGNKTWSLWDAFVLNRCTEHLLPSADITHALFWLQRETPGADKGKGRSGGEEEKKKKIGCHIHRSSLGLCSEVKYYTHSTHFWFEPDSCFWSAALHITGRTWERWIPQDVKGEKWRKTPCPPPVQKWKKREKHPNTEWKQIHK